MVLRAVFVYLVALGIAGYVASKEPPSGCHTDTECYEQCVAEGGQDCD